MDKYLIACAAFALGFITGVWILKPVAVPRHRYQQVAFALCGHDQRPGWRFWVEHQEYLSPEDFERCMPTDPKPEAK